MTIVLKAIVCKENTRKEKYIRKYRIISQLKNVCKKQNGRNRNYNLTDPICCDIFSI